MITKDSFIYLVSDHTLAELLDVSMQEVDKIVALDCWPKPVELLPGCRRWDWDACKDAIDDMFAAAQSDGPH